MDKERITQIEKRHAVVAKSKTFKRVADTFDFPSKRVLDLGCGYGEYMQRFGEGSTGITTKDEEIQFGKHAGLDIRLGNVEKLDAAMTDSDSYDVFWANNIFEHLLAPHAFLVQLKRYATPGALLVLGVPMVPKIESLMRVKKFSGALADAHVGYYTKKTFELTVMSAGWSIIQNRGFVLDTPLLDNLISPIIPHLYLIAKNDQCYRYSNKKLNEWDDEHYRWLIETMHRGL